MLSNYCNLSYNFNSFNVRAFPHSDDKLHSLRRKHNQTHSFFRLDDTIYAIWSTGEDLTEGEVIEIFDDNLAVIERATKHILYRTCLRELGGRKPVSFYPLELVSPRTEHDDAREHLPESLQGIIQFQRLTEIQLRKVYENDRPKLGFTVNIRRRWNCNKTIQKLAQDGFDVIGRPVIYKPSSEDTRSPEEHSIGRIKSYDGLDKCTVTTNAGVEEYSSQSLTLRRSRNEVFDVLEHYTSNQVATSLFDKIYQAGALTSDAEIYCTEIRKAFVFLSKWSYSTSSGFDFTVDTDQNLKLPSIDLNPTTFVFDATPGAASPKVPAGLYQHGPYDKVRFTPKTPRFLVVCSSYNRGGFSKMMGALQNGLPSSDFYQSGLLQTYKLNKIDWEIEELENYDSNTVHKAILRKLESDHEYHLVIIEGSELPEGVEVKDNPYWRAKALCLGQGIPVQAVLPKRTRESQQGMQYKLGPLALQIYAKLGGTPWAIQSSQDVDHEILIGIGNYVQKSSEFKGSHQRRFVGVTTFFSKEGSFILSNKCKAVPYDDYLGELLSNLKEAIHQIENDFSWKESQTIRMIFHVFKPFRRDEVTVIDELIRQFPQYDIRYAFVTVSSHQPLVIFDHRDRSERGSKGHWVPVRGKNHIISPLESLIQLKGKNEIKTITHGFSNPAIIRIHEKSTFRDIHYITQQIYDFTQLSWRGFQPMAKPVTILYSDLIAEKLQILSKLNDWNPSAVGIQLKRKKWFL